MATLLSKAETSYIQMSLTADPPLRADGRGLHDYRPIGLNTGVAPLANGSARVRIGGTDVMAAVRLEVEDVVAGGGADGGRVSCTVTW
jgi:exosome complex component RRP42